MAEGVIVLASKVVLVDYAICVHEVLLPLRFFGRIGVVLSVLCLYYITDAILNTENVDIMKYCCLYEYYEYLTLYSLHLSSWCLAAA